MISIVSSINIYNIIINNKYNENFINIKSIQQEIKYYNKFNISLEKNKKFFKITNPKISLIITVYNQKNFLIKIYSCIKHQSLTDIEIIFIDDASRDNSSSLIKELMMIDKRIVLIQNSLNKGQFYSRNKAVYNAKGEYILIIDPDDLLLNNILIKLYKISKLYNLDILQFYHMIGNYKNNSIFQMNLSVNEILYPPKIKNLFFNCSDRYLWDKLIKRTVYIKSIEFMVEKYRKERFFIHNDEVTCFGLFKVANSYWLLKEVGYFYNRYNYNSTTKQIYKKHYVNQRFRSLFSIMKYYYEFSDNNLFEKNKGGYFFFQLRIIPRNKREIRYLTKEFNYINEVLDLYLNSPFFNEEQKMNLKIFKEEVNKQKMKIKMKKLRTK